MPIFLGDISLEPNSSLDNQEKLFLLGARTQGEDVETYSQNQVYAQGGILYSESKKVATEEYTDKKVADLINSAPDKLNTLDELAAALGDDENFANTVTTEISKKQNIIVGSQGQMVGFSSEGKPIAQDIPSSLPTVNESNNGSFLQVVNGEWAISILPNAEEGVF